MGEAKIFPVSMSAKNVGMRAPKSPSSSLLAWGRGIEAFVPRTQALPLLNEQAGGIQGMGPGFMINLYRAK